MTVSEAEAHCMIARGRVPHITERAALWTSAAALVLAFSAALPRALLAQAQDAGSESRPAIHHDHAPPDYAAAMAPASARPVELPAPPIGPPPSSVRGIYLNPWVFGSKRFYDLIRLADETEVNAFVIDVKDASGYVTYRSAVPVAVAIEANGEVRAPDARSRLERLRAHGIHAIARIVVARDPMLARGKPQWAIKDRNGGFWLDGLGQPWVDTYHDSIWVYAADLAEEAVRMGFAEIQLDYVRFPDEPPQRLARAVYNAQRGGETQRESLGRHLRYMKRRIGALGVPFTIDVFGLTTSTEGGLGIGQHWEDLVELADVVLPMVYPSHYRRGSYGIAHPNSQPYSVVRKALADGIRRAAAVPDAGRIRPYLQAFTLGRPRYTAAEVRAQIAAVEDLGLNEWILWNARGVYPSGALRPIRHTARAATGAAGATSVYP